MDEAGAAGSSRAIDEDVGSVLVELVPTSGGRGKFSQTDKNHQPTQPHLFDENNPMMIVSIRGRVIYICCFFVVFLISILFRVHGFADQHIHSTVESPSTCTAQTPRIKTMSENDEPNPPVWPDSVMIFSPPANASEAKQIMDRIQPTQDPILKWEDFSDNPLPDGYPKETFMSGNHFVEERWALLFTPGDYKGVDFEIGYYVQMLGLGSKADDVTFVECKKGPFISALEKFTVRPPNGLGLDTFWRSAENFATAPSDGMKWVVSQAAPLRRVHIHSNLHLSERDAYVSGGVLANAVVEGTTDFGGQQQWISKNVHFKQKAVNGAWNLVFVGCTGDLPKASNGIVKSLSVTIDKSPRIRVEKPFIALEQDTNGAYNDRFVLRVPPVTKGADAVGPDLSGCKDDVRSFTRVKLGVPSSKSDHALAAKENNESLQAALDEGKDLVLSPGIYFLLEPLVLRKPHQVLLGIGLATLVAPKNGSPCVRVESKTPGVRVAGIMLEASVQDKRNDDNGSATQNVDGIASLFEWGSPDVTDDNGDPDFPGVLTDIFVRVGGSNPDRSVSTDVMVRIHSSNVVGDNLWLWRADHVKLRDGELPNFPHISPHYWQVVKDECKVKNGLVVNGHNVTMHGLFVEHTEETQTIWNGNDGMVRFYQCELPYDVSLDFADNGFVGYKIHEDVVRHDAQGLGIYSNFRDYNVESVTAIKHPIGDNVAIKIKNPFTVKLGNQGMIRTVVNGMGPGPQGFPFRISRHDTDGEL